MHARKQRFRLRDARRPARRPGGQRRRLPCRTHRLAGAGCGGSGIPAFAGAGRGAQQRCLPAAGRRPAGRHSGAGDLLAELGRPVCPPFSRRPLGAADPCPDSRRLPRRRRLPAPDTRDADARPGPRRTDRPDRRPRHPARSRIRRRAQDPDRPRRLRPSPAGRRLAAAARHPLACTGQLAMPAPGRGRLR
ncbi:hypothetical protein SDC9_188168 [bioreactor metagenome]|uniref:Uncharacterized protein n=1 Tax=bioreactor metagenome TaxID=1076179 RepID=A0A645HP62_9ZZZZ